MNGKKEEMSMFKSLKCSNMIAFKANKRIYIYL